MSSKGKTCAVTTKSTHLLENISSETRCRVRDAAVDATGQSGWSDVATKMAT